MMFARMKPASVLWLYILLLVFGGLMGYVKAKSQISLYLSLGFAVALALGAVGILPHWTIDWLQAALLLIFGQRLLQTKKFMPAGLMLVITLVALALRHLG